MATDYSKMIRQQAEARLEGVFRAMVDSNRLLNGLAVLRGYVSTAGTILGYLAFTWSTVVLLGGYVTSLQKKDFWCLTIISLFEATRLFNDLESEAKPFDNISRYIEEMARLLFPSRYRAEPEKKTEKQATVAAPALNIGQLILVSLFEVITMWPALGMVFLLLILKQITPVVFVVIPCWRLRHRDYGVSGGGDNGQASLWPALDIFYCLVLLQGVLAIYVAVSSIVGRHIFGLLQGECNLPAEWAGKALARYLWDTTEKCKKDPASTKDMNLFRHASELVGSDSWEDYNDGLRVVATLVRQGLQGSAKYILPSRPKVQKLIDTLGFRSSGDQGVRCMREFAATVVADFAKDLHLMQFPGAIRCISSLLETTHSGEGVTSNELILQGLKILEKLAFDHHNCEVICAAPGLLPKIMAPVCSSMLIQEIMAPPRASLVNGSFKVVHRLIRTAPGETGTALRCKISSSEQAVSNLERILQDGTVDDNQQVQRIPEDANRKKRIPNDYKRDRQELQILAMEILTELAMDSSTNLRTCSLESLIKKQLQIFLADGGEQEPDTVTIELSTDDPLKTTSGKALALLSKTKDNCLCVISKCDDIFYRLIHMLFDNDASSMIHRKIAAEILENLCTHHTLDEKLLKVLRALLTRERKVKIEEPRSRTYEPGADEENQNSLNEGNNEQTDLKGLLQEALLALLLRLHNSIGADSFALVVQENAQGEGAFVVCLKTIVGENMEATPTSLRIVKLCSQIALSMVHHNQYTAHFKEQKFVESLSKAWDIMSELESCMLVTGTNCRMKPVRPPLSAVVSDLETKLKEEFMSIALHD